LHGLYLQLVLASNFRDFRLMHECELLPHISQLVMTYLLILINFAAIAFVILLDEINGVFVVDSLLAELKLTLFHLSTPLLQRFPQMGVLHLHLLQVVAVQSLQGLDLLKVIILEFGLEVVDVFGMVFPLEGQFTPQLLPLLL
jgi:hypothetical protein